MLPALAERLELGRVHNSQLSNLRNRKLASPGPELFVALGRINQVLEAQPPGGLDPLLVQRLQDAPELLQALRQSALPLLGDDDAPLGPAQLFEIFVGLRSLPAAIDWRISETEAEDLSVSLTLLLTAGRSWRLCREQLMAAYPVHARERRELLEAVVSGSKTYSADALSSELDALRQTLINLGVFDDKNYTIEDLLRLLRGNISKQKEEIELPLGDLIKATVKI